MKKPALALVLTCFVLGCAATGPQPDGNGGSSMQKTKKIPHNFDNVWSAVMETVQDEGWPVASADKTIGRIRTEFVEIGFDDINSWGSCPMEFDTQIMRGRMKLEIVIGKPSLYESTMAIAVTVQGWDEGGKKTWVNCESVGKLEEKIYEGVNKRLSIR
jgi:hypothetical protein